MKIFLTTIIIFILILLFVRNITQTENSTNGKGEDTGISESIDIENNYKNNMDILESQNKEEVHSESGHGTDDPSDSILKKEDTKN